MIKSHVNRWTVGFFYEKKDIDHAVKVLVDTDSQEFKVYVLCKFQVIQFVSGSDEHILGFISSKSFDSSDSQCFSCRGILNP